MAELGINAASSLLQERLGRLQGAENAATQRLRDAAPGQARDSQSFLETLKGAIGEVNEAQVNADKAARDLASGRDGSLHGAMIAMEKAELSLRTMVAVRNKVVEAYQEILRMQV